MTRRRWLGTALSAVPLGVLEAGSGGLLPLNEQGFRQMVSTHRGKVLLVDFWATWCAPCREEMPKLVALSANLAKRGFSLVTVSCDEPEQERSAVAFLDQQSAPSPRYLKHANDDDAFINFIDPKWSGALPAAFLFDRMGTIAAKFIGEVPLPTIEAAIQKALAGSAG